MQLAISIPIKEIYLFFLSIFAFKRPILENNNDNKGISNIKPIDMIKAKYISTYRWTLICATIPDCIPASKNMWNINGIRTK